MCDSKDRGNGSESVNSTTEEGKDANVTFAPGIFDPGFMFGEGSKEALYLLMPLQGRKRQTLFYSRMIDEFFHGSLAEGADPIFDNVKGLRVLFNQHHSALVSYAVNRLSAPDMISFVQQSFHSLHVFFSLGLQFGFEEGREASAEELKDLSAMVKELSEKELDAPPEGG